VMPGSPEASVTLLVKDHPTTVASTGQLATDLDESQYERGHGPCLHAARTGELIEIGDTRTDSWPGLVQSRLTGRLTCADSVVERLRSGAESEPSLRQTAARSL
jgi:hypothetical protein